MGRSELGPSLGQESSDELSHPLAYAEAGGSGITPQSSWFYDRSAEPLGHVRLMLDISPGLTADPWTAPKVSVPTLVVVREILTDAFAQHIRFFYPGRGFSPAGVLLKASQRSHPHGVRSPGLSVRCPMFGSGGGD